MSYTRYVILYHTSPRRNRESILQNGIDHTRGVCGTDYATVGSPPGNYFWRTREQGLAGVAMHEGREWDLYEVDATGLMVMDDACTWGGAYIAEPVSPERLSLVDDAHILC